MGGFYGGVGVRSTEIMFKLLFKNNALQKRYYFTPLNIAQFRGGHGNRMHPNARGPDDLI